MAKVIETVCDQDDNIMPMMKYVKKHGPRGLWHVINLPVPAHHAEPAQLFANYDRVTFSVTCGPSSLSSNPGAHDFAPFIEREGVGSVHGAHRHLEVIDR